MQNIRVTATKKVLINTGNYSNITSEFTIGADVDKGNETPSQVHDKITKLIDGWIEAEIESAKRGLGIS
jgi:hypothetical protein